MHLVFQLGQIGTKKLDLFINLIYQFLIDTRFASIEIVILLLHDLVTALVLSGMLRLHDHRLCLIKLLLELHDGFCSASAFVLNIL